MPPRRPGAASTRAASRIASSRSASTSPRCRAQAALLGIGEFLHDADPAHGHEIRRQAPRIRPVDGDVVDAQPQHGIRELARCDAALARGGRGVFRAGQLRRARLGQTQRLGERQRCLGWAAPVRVQCREQARADERRREAVGHSPRSRVTIRVMRTRKMTSDARWAKQNGARSQRMRAGSGGGARS